MGLSTLRYVINHPLNRGQKLKAILRYFSWQICSRLANGAVAVPYVNHTRLLVERRMSGANGNIYTGLYEFEDMAFVLHLLRKEDLFIDIGANVGAYTILAGGAVGAKCISIEPIPRTVHHLVDNINLNDMRGRVEVHNIGLGKENSTLRFTADLDTVNHVATVAESGMKMLEVPIRTLDSILGDAKPTFIKIDVEGFETDVIAGAEKTLSRNSLFGLVMELNGSGERYGFDEKILHRKMLDFGFGSYCYSPFNRKLTSLDGKNLTSGNTLYLRNVDEVIDRLKTAPRFRIRNVSKDI